MTDTDFIYVTAGVIVIYFFAQVIRGEFDPFAPIWLFLVGYAQVYVIQAISYHDWAIGVRGKEVVGAANFRALWSLLWFLAVYHLPIGRLAAGVLPSAPRAWSARLVVTISPFLVVWGVLCALMVMRSGTDETYSPEAALFHSFPFVMLVAAVMLIVTGRTIGSTQPSCFPAGLAVAALYVLIWMYNGKRSHSLIGVLATVCAVYIPRLKRPSWPVLFATGFVGSLVVAIAIGWRGNMKYDRSFTGFTHFLSDFRVTKILESLNIADGEEDGQPASYETQEYGGFLLMMDTVPDKSEYDFGENYLRIFSTFIPRILWPNKPLYGRERWISAWIAGSELKREENFTGPAIGILGATQLNGGAPATMIVLSCLALAFRIAYEYYRRYADVAWAQFFWAITFFNSWLTVVADDPLAWFYYNWGFTTFPLVILTWSVNKLGGSTSRSAVEIATA